ncbi:MAG: hypothetical protein JRH07_18570 [Deltaproteobacteria bacterium]|nr:hypothetical protein [Deltaproteobacteria bacterium]MBW2123827.1 hypothetical protein [Deltaproteobacteria bacterium]
MGRYGRDTGLAPEEVLRQAAEFFGPDGLGLKVVEQNDCCVSFEGGGGHVMVSAASSESGRTDVELETREWDFQVRSFMERL